MDVKRAIEILTPDTTRYTPKEYEEALELARESLRVKVLEVHDFKWPTGTWEERTIENTEPFLRRRFYCSACGDWNTHGKSRYCPDCGARMEV